MKGVVLAEAGSIWIGVGEGGFFIIVWIEMVISLCHPWEGSASAYVRCNVCGRIIVEMARTAQPKALSVHPLIPRADSSQDEK